MNKSLYFLFTCVILWCVVDLFQAGFTELDPDEAYYWLYSRQLDWGYYDHPPIVALMIAAGYAIFESELGVRLMTVFMHAGTIFLLWLLVGKPKEKRNVSLFLLILAAMPMFQIYGFITTPDPPLLFFTALFFYTYKQFLDKNSWPITFALGIVMVLMLYSKYHGVLIILATLASNLKLLRNPKFYIASIFGASLFIPHLLWQWNNEFPSLQYHLVGRNSPYQLKHTLNYIVNQIINFGPFLFPFWALALWKSQGKDLLTKAYRYCIWGIMGFFLIATLKGHAEPQWTLVLLIPISVLLYQFVF